MLYKKIMHFCKEKNIPLYIFEKECGLGNGTIAGWKTSKPRIDSLQKVAKQMGVSIDKLLEDEPVEQGKGA